MEIRSFCFLNVFGCFYNKRYWRNIRDKTWILSLELKEQETGYGGCRF